MSNPDAVKVLYVWNLRTALVMPPQNDTYKWTRLKPDENLIRARTRNCAAQGFELLHLPTVATMVQNIVPKSFGALLIGGLFASL